MRFRTSTLVLLGGLEVALLAAYAAVTFRELPARYPIHFDAAGRPDHYAPGSSPVWFLVPALAAFAWLLLTALSLLASRLPLRLLNVPDKARLLTLPPDLQDEARGLAARIGLVIALFVVATLGAVQWMLVDVAIDGAPRPRFGPVVAGLALTVLAALWQTATLSRRMRALGG